MANILTSQFEHIVPISLPKFEVQTVENVTILLDPITKQS